MIETIAVVALIIGAASLLTNTAMLGLIALQYIKTMRKPTSKSEGSSALESSRPDQDELKRARAKFDAEQSAFEELMNYNVEQAYGMKPKEE